MNLELVEKGLALGLVAAGSYGLGIVENPEVEFEHEFDLKEVDNEDLTVSFVEDVPGYGENVTGLYTGDRIFVETGGSREQVLETCRHEFLHHFLREYGDFEGEEKMVESLEGQVMVPKCRRLVGRGVQN